jgi:GNAT superfamily N-acetyltransferase
VTSLVNGHVAAVLPGAAVPVNTVLNQFEREPAEVIVDPWVDERSVLVAEQHGQIVAAALLLRYRSDTDAGPGYRGAGEIKWLVFDPMAPSGNPYWVDGGAAAQSLMDSSLAQLERWGTTVHLADGALPAPAIYGVPEQWPHVADLFRRNGFTPRGTESVWLLEIGKLLRRGLAPDGAVHPDLIPRRTVGINGTRFTAVIDGDECGYIEVARLDQPERRLGPAYADIGNLWIAEAHRRAGLGTQLLVEAAEWLRLGGVDLLLAHSSPDEVELTAFLARSGFRHLTTTERGWTRHSPRPC